MTTRESLAGRAPEKKVPVDVRVWNGGKLALWRCKYALDIAAKQAEEILRRCRHAPGCPGREDPDAPCGGDCPDREVRMSAAVIWAAATQLAPPSASKLSEGTYLPPSREYFSLVVAEMLACQAEAERLREVRGTVVEPPGPDEIEDSRGPRALPGFTPPPALPENQ